jgi:protein SCO1/2
MKRWSFVIAAILLSLAVLGGSKSGALFAQAAPTIAARSFPVRGIILEIRTNNPHVVIRHEAIADYMEAMTMPFQVKNPADLSGLKRGDQVTFQLNVTDSKSWVDHFKKIGTVSLEKSKATPPQSITSARNPGNPLLNYKFTNELGQAVSFNDFRGQALAITFIYTRCPLPEYCPRLSKNFQEASRKLAAMTNAPTNWHFISVSFDPQFDSPQMLKSYGLGYGYNPAHWSFFTGPQDKIAALARGVGVDYQTDGVTINHNFRTLIVDPEGRLQMVFPVSGDLSDQIVSEILKAASVRPKPVLSDR